MTEQLQGLKVVDALGVFYRDDTRLMVADEFEGTRDMDVVLSEFEGQHIRLLVHHRPLNPPDHSRWGGGCCFLQSTGHCPFGHHEDAGRVFSFNCAGTLTRTDRGWELDGVAGPLEVPLDFLIAHRGQVIILRSSDTTDLQEKVDSLDPSNLKNPSIEDLYSRLNEIKDTLVDINRLKDGIDV
jgi:hypothetical protein